MALSKVDYNSINVTAAASQALKWNSSANGFETGDVSGSLVLLATETASGDSTLSFTSSIDSTYDEYVFRFYDFNPATDAQSLTFQASTDGGSSYGVTATTSWFVSYHNESGTDGNTGYSSGLDIAQGTGYQPISTGVGNDADSSVAGTLWLFNPSNTTYVKHFYTRANNYSEANGSYDSFAAGYFNTTAAITAIDFKMSSGNMDAVIKMYGVG